LAAIVKEDGKPHILKTNTGEFFTPSVVSFNRGALLVGNFAWENTDKAPKDTIYSIKRLMGRSFDDDNVRKLKDSSPYSIIECPNSELKVLLNDVEYSPEAISAMILRQVVEDARTALGGEKITHAVITVPAYFSEIQRAATRKAGEQAGLIIQKIIDEPTAAAFAFGMYKSEEYPNLLVFDMGGGTLDISLLYVKNRKFVVDATKGNMWLAGDNFDQKIVEIINDWVKEFYGKELLHDKEFIMAAKREAEKAKKCLTDNPQADVIIPAFVPLDSGEKVDIALTVSSSEFEKRIEGDVEESIQLVRQVLKDNNLETGDISKVILVGGATFVPLVRRKLEELFGQDKVKYDVDPMEAVALGAAILADNLDGVECPNCNEKNDFTAKECTKCQNSLVTGRPVYKGIECPKCEEINKYDNEKCEACGHLLESVRSVRGLSLYEITERDFGIGVVDQKGETDEFSRIISAGTPYPLKKPKKHRYMTTSRKIKIPVYVGDKPKASENEYLGLVDYELPRDAPSETPVWVSFNYDRHRILTVGIEVEGRPELNHQTTPKRHVPKTSALDGDQLRASLHNAIEFIKNMSEKFSEFFEDEQKREIEKDLRNASQALRQKDSKVVQKALETLMQIQQNFEIITVLQMSDMLMLEVNPKTSQYLAELSKKLRDAYRESKKDSRVKQIQRVLEREIVNIFENFPLRSNIKDYGGILRKDAEYEKKSSPRTTGDPNG
jgi:molecular chaperone DnaK (HSP70)